MNEQRASRFELAQVALEVVGAAAAVTCAFTVPQGERWRVVWGLTSQDDAAHTHYFTLTRDGVGKVLNEPFTTAANTRYQFYTYVIMPECLIMRYGDVLSSTSNAMAAGKQITFHLLVEKLIGESA